MTREELIARLHDEEDNYVERKLAGAANAEEIRKTVVAFANSTPVEREALLFIGVADGGRVDGGGVLAHPARGDLQGPE